MTLAEHLREYNDWRRGGDFSQPNPRDLGVLIDKSADRLEAAEKLIEQLESALKNIVEFWDSVVPDDCVNTMHKIAREALAAANQFREGGE